MDRRVTFDRAVWTKPLAFAADAARQLCALNREDHRRSGACADCHGAAIGGGHGHAGACEMRPLVDAVIGGRTHLRRPRVRARLEADGGARASDYELSWIDVGEERREVELPRGQSFDDAHGRAAAGTRPRARRGARRRVRSVGGGVDRERPARHVARSSVRQRGASRPK